MIIENKKLILLHTKQLKDKLKDFNYSKEEIDNLKNSLSFLIDDNFIIGCKLVNEKIIKTKYYLVYMAEDKNINNKIYIRTKLKICKHWIEKLKEKYPIISVVNKEDKKAIRFNYKLLGMCIQIENNEYLKDKLIFSNDIRLLLKFLNK